MIKARAVARRAGRPQPRASQVGAPAEGKAEEMQGEAGGGLTAAASNEEDDEREDGLRRRRNATVCRHE